MSGRDFWDDWFKRFRRWGFFPGFDSMFRDMEREMEEFLKEIEKGLPQEMMREVRMPDGSVRREYGPFVYGYSVRIGPDGKPVVNEFGNFRPGLGPGGKPLSLQEKREPLVDIIEGEDTVRVVAELPGVEKKDIKLYATDHGLTIDVKGEDRQYYKELEFDSPIDKTSAKSTYRNGVLEVSFKKKGKEKGTPINVE